MTRGSFWPTPAQKLLLQAALRRDEKAVVAWQQWQERVDMDQLDQGSQRLLPLLYRNLVDQGIPNDQPVMNRLKGVYRLSWARNQLLLQAMTRQVHVLHQAGFSTILLKGAALTLGHYTDDGIRPMADFDLLVRKGQVPAVDAMLKQSGWLPKFPHLALDNCIQVVHAYSYVNSSGLECDLHWHVAEVCMTDAADHDFWDGAVPLDLQGVPTAILHPADQLLHVCVHGARWNHVPPLRWLADTLCILNTCEADFDWERLLAQVRKHHLVLPVRDTLNYLQEHLGAAVPPAIRHRLAALPVTPSERLEYRYCSRNLEKRFFRSLPYTWFRYARTADDATLGKKCAGFLRFLHNTYDTPSLWQLPGLLMKKGFQSHNPKTRK